MHAGDVGPSSFREALAGLLDEFIGKRKTSKFLALGPDARIIADSGVNLEDQEDFWVKLHSEFSIAPPWQDAVAAEKPSLRSFLNWLSPEETYVFPDLSISELERVARVGRWPEGVVQVEINRRA